MRKKQKYILVALSTLILALVSFLTLSLYHRGTEELLSQFRGRQHALARHLSSQIRFYFEARARGLKALSSLPSMTQGPPERRKSDLEAYARQIETVYVKAVSAFDSRGVPVWQSNGARREGGALDPSILAWAREKKNAGKVMMTLTPSGTGALVALLATPLYGTGGFAGVASFTLDVAGFLSQQMGVEGLLAGPDRVRIMDSGGKLLFDPQQPDMVFRKIGEKDASCRSCHSSFGYMEDMLRKKEGVGRYSLKGCPEERLAAFAPMSFQDLSWVVVVSAPYEGVAGFVKKSLMEHLLLLSMILAVLFSGAVLYVRSDRTRVRAENEAIRLQDKVEERQKAEAALKTERNKLKRILDAMNEGVYIANRSYDLVYCNPVIEQDKGEAKGRKCYQYVFGKADVCEWCKGPLVFAGKKVRWEWSSARTGKTYELLETPIENAEGDVAKLSIVRDITAGKKAERKLRESEERHRHLVETMNDGLGVQDEHGLWVYANKRLCDILGFEASDLLGRPVRDLLDEKNRPVYDAQMVERAKGNGGFYEIAWLTREGPPAHTLVSAQPMLHHHGKYRGSFAIITDISKRKRAEEALEQSEKQLRRLSAQILSAQETERKRISRELHDELGQALTVMKLHMGFIRKHLKEDQEILKEECERGIEHVDEIIENVRRLSRDLSPAILEDFGLAAALRWLVNNFGKRHKVTMDFDGPDIDLLVGREARTVVYRMIQEALTNVVKHARAKNISIDIRRTGENLTIAVEDDGSGFDMDETLSKRPEERGLGLTTMKAHAQTLGGAITITSEQGKGTKVAITMPLGQLAGEM